MSSVTTPADESPTGALREHEDQIILEATSILRNRVFNPKVTLFSADDVRQYLRLCLTNEKRVLFGVVFLHANNRAVEFEILFHGSSSEVHVYTRQILERVLHHNAAAVILVHNRPSGSDTPSEEDRRTTARLREGLAYFDVRVLDHLIIGHDSPFSFAEHGLL